MRKSFYRTIDDVQRSPWASLPAQQKTHSPLTDRVLCATKLEDSIYADLRTGDEVLEQVEQDAKKKLRSFPALSQDVFQSIYSLMPRRRDSNTLSVAARKFNAPILDHMAQSEDFPALKAVCEGKELPAYEAAAEFTTRISKELDQLLDRFGGGTGTAAALEKLEDAQAQMEEELSALLDLQGDATGRREDLEKSIIAAANAAESKRRQVEAVNKLIDTAAAQNKAAIATAISSAVEKAAKKAEETEEILSAWSDSPGRMEKSPVNRMLLEKVRGSEVLRNVAKYLGRFREIFAQGRHNGYTYGRGETYALELGNNLTKALSSELALLSTPETIPLFLQKYQRRQIKQYQRREPVYQGMGDIICCLDESDSTEGDAADWGKAVALTLLEIAAESGRRFALIHFSSAERFQTDLFLPNQYGIEEKMQAAETFLSGGTNFATPMKEALRLMAEEGFERADIVFVTDGACELPADMLESLREEQSARRFTVTGILLDQGSACMSFSLQPFCSSIYRASELTGDEIVRRLVAERA